MGRSGGGRERVLHLMLVDKWMSYEGKELRIKLPCEARAKNVEHRIIPLQGIRRKIHLVDGFIYV